jgi:hypothetical protein
MTNEWCQELANYGMISDALWTDFNNDGKPDLVLAGEWNSLGFFENKNGKLVNITISTGIADKKGWWNSLAGADFDNDGDVDFAAGNFGENIFFKCDSDFPLTIYSKDFDNNGLYDAFISCYWNDSTHTKKEFFYHTRDDMIKQLVSIRAKFKTYGEFGSATADKVFTSEELKDALIFKANWMKTSFIENKGNGKFVLTELPVESQLAPVYGIHSYDYDLDGLLDIVLVGNDYGMELMQGRADAFYGLVLRNMGNNKFKAIGIDESHFFVPKDARALTRIEVKGSSYLLATQNRDSLKIFTQSEKPTIVDLNDDEMYAEVRLKNGKTRKKEFYWGSTFHSQEPRNILLDRSMTQLLFYNRQNKLTRTVKP